MTLTVGSLFAGIGGFDLGFERAGFEIRWQVEIDPFCRAVLAQHWPDVRRYEDVRTVGAADLATVDVLCGGFPCQPHSLAGRRAASADERDLWPAFRRLIRELEPRWVVAENVSGLLSSDAGRFFGDVLRDLAESGYDAEWDCIPASAVGAPHRRDRVWIVAYPERAELRHESGWRSGAGWADSTESRDDGAAWTVADASRGIRQRAPSRQAGHFAFSREDVADAESARLERRLLSGRVRSVLAGPWEGGGAASDYWRTEPNVGRVAHGIPARVDRLRGLGNSIVPQIAEWIARRIADVETDFARPARDEGHHGAT